MKMRGRRVLTVVAISMVAFGVGQMGIAGDEDESFAKYGQVFKGKIAKSYAESEEWWPSTPHVDPQTA